MAYPAFHQQDDTDHSTLGAVTKDNYNFIKAYAGLHNASRPSEVLNL